MLETLVAFGRIAVDFSMVLVGVAPILSASHHSIRSFSGASQALVRHGRLEQIDVDQTASPCPFAHDASTWPCRITRK
jgi:hypothetical protein